MGTIVTIIISTIVIVVTILHCCNRIERHLSNIGDWVAGIAVRSGMLNECLPSTSYEIINGSDNG